MCFAHITCICQQASAYLTVSALFALVLIACMQQVCVSDTDLPCMYQAHHELESVVVTFFQVCP